jgi:uncharacterized protein YndB with AHSA1/START domain
MHGTYDEEANALRFERRLAHPIEEVWEAVSRPEGLGRWFPAGVELDLRAGAAMTFTFPGAEGEPMAGQVVAVDPPRLLEFLWEEDRLRFELEPDGDGTLFRLTHQLTRRPGAAKVAAGWHVCVDALDRLLREGSAKQPSTEPTPEHRALEDAYLARGLPAGDPA